MYLSCKEMIQASFESPKKQKFDFKELHKSHSQVIVSDNNFDCNDINTQNIANNTNINKYLETPLTIKDNK